MRSATLAAVVFRLGAKALSVAAAVSAASAADLPGEPVPAAVDYVKVCDAMGAGFFYLPGTETCLDISGRLRARMQFNQYEARGTTQVFRFRADSRIDIDVRSATEYGLLRVFTRMNNQFATSFDDPGANSGARIAGIQLAFVQLGYVTAGLQGDVADGDVLYGDNSAAYQTGDSDLVGATLLVDNIGGGFYAGAGVYSGRGGRDNIVWGEDDVDDYANLMVQGVAGISGQPWGSFDLSLAWNPRDDYLTPAGIAIGVAGDLWSIKATADLTLSESLNARLVAAYLNYDDGRFVGGNSYVTLAGAVSYGFTDAATAYTGVRWDIADVGDDIIRANLGMDYIIVRDLIGTAEVAYANVNSHDEWTGMLQLTRNW